jgi:DNA-binding transcriptional ArsR family regulator
MKASELLIPQFEIKNNIINCSNVFNLLQQPDDKNRNLRPIFVANGVHEPMRPLSGHTDNDGDGDGDGDSYAVLTNDLRNNDRKILSLLNEEIWSTYSFKALERKLDIHQQSLARALKRLRELDLVEKTPNGYKLIEKNSIFSSKEITGNNQSEEVAEPETTETRKTRKRFNQLIQISIPIRNNTDQITNHLVGKWFGNLRWFGLIQKETGITLQWIAVDKLSNNKMFQINVNIVSEYIVIESNADSDNEKVEAMSYSNRIVNEIIKTLQVNMQEECHVPEEFNSMPKEYVAVPSSSKAKYNLKKNN